MNLNLRAAGMRGIDAVLATFGVDVLPLLAAHGIPSSALTNEEERISLGAYAHLLEAAAEQAVCSDLGLRMAAHQDITILGPLAIAMQNAATIGEAVELCSRFLHTHSPGIRMSVHDHRPTGNKQALDSPVALRINLILPGWWRQVQLMEQCLADLHHFTSMLSGGPEILHEAQLAVQLSHEPSAESSRYQEAFGTLPEFSAAHSQFVVPRAFLERRLGKVSEELHRLSVDYLQLAFAPGEVSLTEKVESILQRALGTTRGRREVIAKLLDIHPRTLQRRLMAEGTEFRDLVDRARREQAQRWLCTSSMPLAQLAGMIGLADQSVLNRNCRRWFGCTPRQLRNGKMAQARVSH